MKTCDAHWIKSDPSPIFWERMPSIREDHFNHGGMSQWYRLTRYSWDITDQMCRLSLEVTVRTIEPNCNQTLIYRSFPLLKGLVTH
jgi:hypothetical protein